MAKTAEKSTAGTQREFRAEARFQRTSPQKAKLVLDTIKGQRVEQALNTLMFTRKRIAPVVEKALRSAVQNANYQRRLAHIILVVAEKNGTVAGGAEAKAGTAAKGKSKPVKKVAVRKSAKVAA